MQIFKCVCLLSENNKLKFIFHVQTELNQFMTINKWLIVIEWTCLVEYSVSGKKAIISILAFSEERNHQGALGGLDPALTWDVTAQVPLWIAGQRHCRVKFFTRRCSAGQYKSRSEVRASGWLTAKDRSPPSYA